MNINICFTIIACLFAYINSDDRIGNHEFIILKHLTNTSRIYATHLPMYTSPFDYQFIFEAEINSEFNFLDNQYYEAVASNISLTALINSTFNEFNVNVYEGSPNLNNLIIPNVSLSIINIVNSRRLTPKAPTLDPSYVIFGGDMLGNYYLSHVVEGNPNFDLVVKASIKKYIDFQDGHKIFIDKTKNIETERLTEGKIDEAHTIKSCNEGTVYFDITNVFTFSCRSGPQISGECKPVNKIELTFLEQ